MFGLFKGNKRLPDDVQRRVEGLSSQAVRALARNDADGRQQAYRHCLEALELLPEPPGQWPQAAQLFAVLGDVYWQSGDFETASNAYIDAISCRDALGDAALHLRLGRAHYELGDSDRAADELCRAYLASAHAGRGLAIFEGEDPKYFEFLKTRMQAPHDGW